MNRYTVGRGLLAITFALPAMAHYSVSARFVTSKTIAVEGTVTALEWTNPHARLWVDARNEDGAVTKWELELPPPNAMKLRNWRSDFVETG